MPWTVKYWTYNSVHSINLILSNDLLILSFYIPCKDNCWILDINLFYIKFKATKVCCGCYGMVHVDGFTTTCTCMQSVPVTTKVLSSNPVHGEVYSISQYNIMW